MTTDADLELIRELHPEGDGASTHARQRARALLLEQIDSERRHVRIGTRRRFKPRLLPSIGLTGAGVAMVVAIALVAELRGGVARPTSAAAAVLVRAALVAEAAGGPRELRPGEYWYVHSREIAITEGQSSHGELLGALVPLDRQVWFGLRLPGRIISRVIGPVDFLSASARKQWGGGNQAPGGAAFDLPIPPNAFLLPYRRLLALPTNVDALWRMMDRQWCSKGHCARPRPHDLITQIGDLLREDPLPARLRAALYRVAARIPGIQMLGLTRDGIGRPALAVALDDPVDRLRYELLFDPRTARFLGESQVLLRPNPQLHAKAGTVFFESTCLASGIVQRIGQRLPR